MVMVVRVCTVLDCSGTWEHKARLQEMAATSTTVRPDSLTESSEGRHHIGDFLPAEELNKFLTRYKVEYRVSSL